MIKKIKIFLLLFFIATCAVTALSYVYNFPIHFWPAAPGSVTALYEAGNKPDNIVLTPTDDLRTKARITWRVANSVSDGVVQYTKADGSTREGDQEIKATATVLYSRELKSNSTVYCYSTTIDGLSPGTTYRYRVGSRLLNSWSDYHTFRTAPATVDSLTFAYFGDTQTSPELLKKMLFKVEEKHPETAFYMIAGDLVDNGALRNLWDALLSNTDATFSRKPLVPALGNHDFSHHISGVKNFAAYFALPSTKTLAGSSPLNYSFQYGKAFFIIINSRERDLGQQTEWLEAELERAQKAGCTVKVVMCHFPVFTPRDGSYNKTTLQFWVPLFDRYDVDLVLTGHDHSYLRSKPLKAGKPVTEKERGTIFVTATACEKFYKFLALDVAEKQFGDTATYQIIKINFNGDAHPIFRYYAYDPDGRIMDQF